MFRQGPNNENNGPDVKYAVAGILSSMASQPEPGLGASHGMPFTGRAGAALLTPTTLTSLEETFSESVVQPSASNGVQQKLSLKRKHPSLVHQFAQQMPVNYAVDSLSHLTEDQGLEDEGCGEKKKIRRERNKVAAAKCRQKRVDQTNTLQVQVDDLDAETTMLNDELSNLQREKEQLEFVLQAHRPMCRMVQVPMADRPINLSLTTKRSSASLKKSPLRPTCLPVASSSKPNPDFNIPASQERVHLILPPKKSPIRARKFLDSIIMKKEAGELHTPIMNEGAGIAITTPSKDIPSFSVSSSGYTPITEYPITTPSASSGFLRQRSSSSSAGSEMTSPGPVLASL